jgi:lipopolysaccharide/colanic/teichoic acid biosynthesis glycosyltransferase
MYKQFLKRFVDFSVALIALLVTSPLLILATIFLSIANKGSAFFGSPTISGFI